MRKYELVCILHPDLEETAFNESVEKIRGWVTEAGGSVEKVDLWGRRKMAYAIRKQNEGQYILLNISMPPTSVAALEQNLRFLEANLRHMVTAIE
jgi:small subunit ribosomal protein S6